MQPSCFLCPPCSIFLFILPSHANSLAFPLDSCPSNLCNTYPVCGVSFSGDIQDPPGQGPVQPAVGDPALAGGLD